MKTKIQAFLKGKLGSTINVLLHQIASAALTAGLIALADGLSKIDLADQPKTVVTIFAVINLIIVAIRQFLKK